MKIIAKSMPNCLLFILYFNFNFNYCKRYFIDNLFIFAFGNIKYV